MYLSRYRYIYLDIYIDISIYIYIYIDITLAVGCREYITHGGNTGSREVGWENTAVVQAGGDDVMMVWTKVGQQMWK